MEQSRRAEDELERYLLCASDEESMKLEACAACCSPTLPENADVQSPMAGPAQGPREQRAVREQPVPERVLPYEDEN